MKALVILRSDPASSPRGAEAVRVALGLASEALEVDLLCMGPGVRALGPSPWELEDGRALEDNRRRLGAAGVTILAAGEGEIDPGLEAGRITLEEAAERMAGAERLLPF